MSIPSNSSQSLVNRFGRSGQESETTMSKTLQNYDLRIQYNSTSNQFTVLNSADLSKQKIQEIFDTCSYSMWKPIATDC